MQDRAQILATLKTKEQLDIEANNFAGKDDLKQMIEFREKQLIPFNRLRDLIVEPLFENSTPTKDLEGNELNEENIKKRISKMAEQLIKDYKDKKPLFVILLNGALPFATALEEDNFKKDVNFNYNTMKISVSSYGNNLEGGKVKVGSIPADLSVLERDIVILDDLRDTGETLKTISKQFRDLGAQTVKTAVLTQKKGKGDFKVNYCGFDLPPEAFIIGFGLDYCGGLREKMSIRDANRDFLATPEELAALSIKDEIVASIESLKDKASIKITGTGQTVFEKGNADNKIESGVHSCTL